MIFLVDTNILVYRHDPRDPRKQGRARGLLRDGIANGEAVLPHQALVEFVAATTRPIGPSGASVLSPQEARREAEELLDVFPVLYPSAETFRLALRGMAAYGLSWFDAHMWAYAEHFGVPAIMSEDFQHGRRYGTVRIVNPFLE
ncbi:MAG: PIN domain-containing protein [Deltaproteobacteria bacterium]|nr:PIN domain-containing protein [Deltaproteobacteria bacterium]